jgi:hypothetical protein
MSIQVTVTLPERLVERAQQWAIRMNCDVADVITRAASLSLSSLELPPLEESPPNLESLSDAQVLTLTHLQMAPKQDARLSVLLDRQQADALTVEERDELDNLMSHYEIGLLRKAEALAEAVRRGLREPLHP